MENVREYVFPSRVERRFGWCLLSSPYETLLNVTEKEAIYFICNSCVALVGVEEDKKFPSLNGIISSWRFGVPL